MFNFKNYLKVKIRHYINKMTNIVDAFECSIQREYYTQNQTINLWGENRKFELQYYDDFIKFFKKYKKYELLYFCMYQETDTLMNLHKLKKSEIQDYIFEWYFGYSFDSI
tara:strand:+ start:731 stop:1060 length:330 start_codon:yes stop_codon:yes gene_type:complete